MDLKFEHILMAIRDCDKGNLKFNLGDNESFFFDGKWYPVSKIINLAFENANQITDYNLHQATMILSKFLPVITLNVVFVSNKPVNAL